jgi:hypothetical protein
MRRRLLDGPAAPRLEEDEVEVGLRREYVRTMIGVVDAVPVDRAPVDEVEVWERRVERSDRMADRLTMLGPPKGPRESDGGGAVKPELSMAEWEVGLFEFESEAELAALAMVETRWAAAS